MRSFHGGASGTYRAGQTFEDFVAAIVSGGQPLIDGIEGRRSVELILAIYEAASTGIKANEPLHACFMHS